jgi:DNA-binding transcriptional ArsR family regulator
VKKLLVVAFVFLIFTFAETFLAIDYAVYLETGTSPLHGGEVYGPTPNQTITQSSFLFFWGNSPYFSATGWVIIGVTFFRKGISKKWRELGFDKEVFDLMVKARGALSRLTLLSYLDQPRHRSELTALSGLDWKEVDRELSLLIRFGLISLYVESGSVKIYKLSEQGRVILRLVEELGTRTHPREIAR